MDLHVFTCLGVIGIIFLATLCLLEVHEIGNSLSMLFLYLLASAVMMLRWRASLRLKTDPAHAPLLGLYWIYRNNQCHDSMCACTAKFVHIMLEYEMDALI